MKFAALLVVAVAVCGSVVAKAPKAKQLIGEWQFDPTTVSQMLGMGEALPEDIKDLDVDALLILERGDKAQFVADVSMSMEVEAGVSMIISFNTTFSCTWSYEDESLKVNVESYDFSMKNIAIDPANPEFEQMLPFILPTMEKALSEEMDDSLRSVEVVKDGVVELVSNDEIKITERGNNATMTLTRK